MASASTQLLNSYAPDRRDSTPSVLAVAKRKNYWLLPHAITVPAYWFLQSVAAYKALFQLIARPFYWEKTAHGISKYTASELLRAGSAG